MRKLARNSTALRTHRVKVIEDESVIENILANLDYWQSNALPEDDRSSAQGAVSAARYGLRDHTPLLPHAIQSPRGADEKLAARGGDRGANDFAPGRFVH